MKDVNQDYKLLIKEILIHIIKNPEKAEPYFHETFHKQILSECFNELTKIVEKNGRVMDIIEVSRNRFDSRHVKYFVELKNQSRLVIRTRFDKSSGQIAEFQAEGMIRDADYMTVEENFVPMTDGLKMRTFCFKKNNDVIEKPVVLVRTPYMNLFGQLRHARHYQAAEYFLERGYHYIVQAIRGTNGSEGEYRIIHPQEIIDGETTVKWIGKQPFCDGNIGIVGTSYEGFTALAAGIKNPDKLKCIFAASCPTNLYTDFFLGNGVLNMITLDYLRYNQTGEGEIFTKGFSTLCKEKLLNVPDLSTYDRVLFGIDIPEWKRITASISDPQSSFWKEREIFSKLHEIEIPTIHLAGMGLDGNLADVVRNFTYIQEKSKKTENHSLILGKWGHGNSTPYGDGSNLSNYMKKRFDNELAFYLKESGDRYKIDSNVVVESSHPDRFNSSSQYPLTGDKFSEIKLYFNRNDSDCYLLEKFESKVLESTYAMKPQELNTFSDFSQHLFFQYECLSPINLFGLIHLELYLSIEVPQTDIMIFVTKSDVDGKLHYHPCRPSAKIIRHESGINRLTINTSPFCETLLEGEKLGFEITSNIFPVTARNRNASIDEYLDAFNSATIRLLHSKQYRSSIVINLEK